MSNKVLNLTTDAFFRKQSSVLITFK